MPFVGATDPVSSRKRRWHDDNEEGEEEMSAQQQLYHHHLYSADADSQQDILLLNQHHRPRKSLPRPKRTRLAAADGDVDVGYHDDYAGYHQHHLHDHKKREKSGSRSAPLTPCHICHRKPTKKSHLDSFADCEGCGQRTCFVCIRQCYGRTAGHDSVLSEQEVLSRSFHMDDAPPLVDDDSNANANGGVREPERDMKGWDAGGHRGVVCSRCCVERGLEGDVACLGCLSSMEAACE